MVMITLYTRQQKRHWCIEQSYGLCGRGRGWEDLGEWHWNMYNIMYEMSRQSKFDARYWMLGAGALGRPRGMVWGGRREEGSGWGTCVCLWRIHFNIWQNQYNIVKFKNKIKLKKKKKESCSLKNWCFWTVVLKNTESPLDCKKIKPVNHEGHQSWIFIGRTDAEAEAPTVWLPDKNQLVGKDPGGCERLKARGEGDDRGWGGWMTSLTL